MGGGVADSLDTLRKTFCAAKKEARRKYVNCHFYQMDYDLVLKKAASAIRTLPIQIDYLNQKGKTALIEGVGDATEKHIHLVLGSPLGRMQWKCTFSKWNSTSGKHKKGMIQIDIEWVNKYNADYQYGVWYSSSGHRETFFLFFLHLFIICSCAAVLDMINLILFGEESFYCNCLLITNLFITLPIHSRVLSVLDHVFGS